MSGICQIHVILRHMTGIYTCHIPQKLKFLQVPVENYNKILLLLRLRTAHSSLDTRLAHISPAQYLQVGPHKPFDLQHRLTIGHQPNAFLKTLLPCQEEG